MASRRVTLVCVPNAPLTDVEALEGLLKKASPDSPIVVGYDANVQIVEVGVTGYTRQAILVMAPDAPAPADVDILREKFNDPSVSLIVVNYNVTVMDI
jgi:hypothetical protein